ncbi:hypothetical protein Bbelb_127170 [Branchiostoma belcheri]|nr:hypothetical protein Bbelb_127170 [Branchiostoma belcheri]
MELSLHVRWSYHCTSDGVITARQMELSLHVRWSYHCTSDGVITARQMELSLHVRWSYHCTSDGVITALVGDYRDGASGDTDHAQTPCYQNDLLNSRLYPLIGVRKVLSRWELGDSKWRQLDLREVEDCPDTSPLNGKVGRTVVNRSVQKVAISKLLLSKGHTPDQSCWQIVREVRCGTVEGEGGLRC